MGDSRTCCCGCCSVRTGTIIISTIWLIMALWNILACCTQLIVLTDTEKYDVDKLVASSYTADDDYKQAKKEFYIKYRPLATGLTVLLLIGELVNVPLSGYCLQAAVKRGPSSRILLWICFNSLCAVVSALVSLLIVIYMTKKLGDAVLIGGVLGFVSTYGFYYYLIRVVYQYMEEVQQGHGAGGAVVLEPVALEGVRIGGGIGLVPGNAGKGRTQSSPPPYQEKV